ncbi:20034_t:CDS:2, partial [Rhizophagus irregularis]
MTKERSLLQRTITNRFEKYVSNNTLQPVMLQINKNERKWLAEEISHTITTPPNLHSSVEKKEANNQFLFLYQIVKDECYRRCSTSEDK